MSAANAKPKPVKPTVTEIGGAINNLQQVVEKLCEVKQLNDKLQAQYSAGSSSWHHCESIDDRLHEAFVLLGE